jgi:nucleoid DNA-binding protein
MPDTKTLINALKDSMPNVVKDDAQAEKIVDAFYETCKDAFGSCENVTFHGVGEFHIGAGGKEMVFTPDRLLLDTMNEGTTGVPGEKTPA